MDDLEPRLAVAENPNETLPFSQPEHALVEEYRTEKDRVPVNYLHIEELKNNLAEVLQRCIGTETKITYGGQEFLVRGMNQDENGWIVELGLGWKQPETGLSAGTVPIRLEDLLESLEFIEEPPQKPQSL